MPVTKTPQEFDHEKYQSRAKAIAYKFRFSGIDQDDLEQIAMIAFWEAERCYDPAKANEMTCERFAYHIGCRRVRDELRAKRSRWLGVDLDSEPLDQHEDAETLESRLDAKFFLDRISDRYRSVLCLRMNGLNFREIGEQIGTRKARARVVYCDALRACRNIVEDFDR